MREERLLQQAKACGFDHVSIIPTDQIIFDSGFRKFCKSNYCGNYNSNYSCPPFCGTPKELEEKAKAFPFGLVLQTVTPVKDIMDDGETREIKHRHNKMTWKLIEAVSEELSEYLPAMAGPCQWCSPCRMQEGKPCRFPEKTASCLSAFCVQVDALAMTCGMEYRYQGKVAFFSLLFYGKEK